LNSGFRHEAAKLLQLPGVRKAAAAASKPCPKVPANLAGFDFQIETSSRIDNGQLPPPISRHELLKPVERHALFQDASINTGRCRS
jgi:hypothetical protein